MRRVVLYLMGLLIVAAVGFAGWTWITLHYTYSRGERAGYVQKISNKGWLCKTWEGELAMVNLPGAMPQIFTFSVRESAIARQIEQSAGQRVSLSYEYHPGVPTSCFGDTNYFIVKVTPIKDGNAPPSAPATPALPK